MIRQSSVEGTQSKVKATRLWTGGNSEDRNSATVAQLEQTCAATHSCAAPNRMGISISS